MIKHIRYLIYLYVFIGYSLSQAGSFEDYFAAIQQDNAAQVKLLLARGFDPNTVNESGQHGLLLAMRDQSKQVAELLVDDPRTEIEVQTPQKETPLMLAALRGWLDVCKKLLARDADVNRPGWTPLHYAATSGHLDIIRLLLDQHAYIDAESPNGSTPLMMAAQYGTKDSVKLLLQAGADPNLKNNLGLTAIDFAMRVQNTESAELIAAAVRAQRPKGSW